MTKVFLGVDGGASKTAVVVIDNNKNVAGVALAGPVNFNAVGLKTALENLRTGILQALEGLKPKKIFGCFALANEQKLQ